MRRFRQAILVKSQNIITEKTGQHQFLTEYHINLHNIPNYLSTAYYDMIRQILMYFMAKIGNIIEIFSFTELPLHFGEMIQRANSSVIFLK